jgi:hypothetical protein
MNCTDEMHTEQQPAHLLHTLAPVSHDAKVRHYVRLLQTEAEIFADLSPNEMGTAKQKIIGLLTRIWEERIAEQNEKKQAAVVNKVDAAQDKTSAGIMQ